MITRWLKQSFKNRFLVIGIFLALIGFGLWSIPKLSIDAVPDITNVQVVVNTKTGALDPEQIEKTITQYIEMEMGGIPKVDDVRSLSKYGLSQVTIVFKEGTNIYWARQQVSERLQTAMEELPTGVSPELAPISTGLGEVLMYVIVPKPNSELSKKPEKEQLLYLRTVQDTIIRPYLKSKVPNVADIDSTGGFKKEIHVDVSPQKMAAYGITLEQLSHLLERSGENAGGGYIEQEGQQIIVRSNGTIPSLEEFKQTPIKLSVAGQSIRLQDIAEVREDHAQRLGAATFEGKESVLGTILMLSGANSREVAIDTQAALTHVPLPDDVMTQVVYSRSFLVDATIHTVLKNLAEGAGLVVAVLLFLFGNFRAALLVALTIPIAMLMAVTGMKPFGISANLMSLGAIDFGLLVDGAIVIIENLLRRFNNVSHTMTRSERIQLVFTSTKEVIQPVILGLGLIMLVYVPILSLQGIEGKLFKPMAITVLLALGSALIVTLFLIPVLASFVLSTKPQHEEEPLVFRAFQKIFIPLINKGLKFPKIVLVIGLLVCIFAGTLYTKLGSDFMPPLDEGDMVINFTRDSRMSIDTSVEIQKKCEAVIRQFNGIAYVFSRMGTAESATDPMGPHLSDTFIILNKDHKTWPKEAGKPVSKERFFALLKEKLESLKIEQEISATQPIEMRFNEILEGSRADVSLRIFGPDLNQLSTISTQVLEVLESVKGTEIELDALTALRKSPVLNVEPIKSKLNLYDLHLEDVNLLIETAMTGKHVGSFYDQNWRYPIILRVAEELRNSPQAISALPLTLPQGGSLPLSAVTQLHTEDRVTTIAHSNGKRYAGLAINLSGRNVQDVVKEAQEKISSKVSIPKGYTLEWGGQFQNLHNAQKRLAIIIPLTIFAIFVLVLGYLKNLKQTLLVLLSIPFAVTGGIFALALRGLPFTVSAGVGFIALMGIAILNTLVLITFINQLIQSGKPVRKAIHEGVLTRLKPVLSTALVASLGFIPMALNTGMGSEVQRPLATVVIGGLVTSTLLTLLVLPSIYSWLEKKRGNHE